jgi:hypothetical protein
MFSTVSAAAARALSRGKEPSRNRVWRAVSITTTTTSRPSTGGALVSVAESAGLAVSRGSSGSSDGGAPSHERSAKRSEEADKRGL